MTNPPADQTDLEGVTEFLPAANDPFGSLIIGI